MSAAGSTDFGGLLKQLRLAAGLTQEALAERAGNRGAASRPPTRRGASPPPSLWRVLPLFVVDNSGVREAGDAALPR